MIHDKLAEKLKELTRLRNDLREIKKEMKEEERMDTEDYLEMKGKVKDLRGQVKDMEEQHATELRTTELYQNLLEARVAKEEEVGKLSEEISKTLTKLPRRHFSMDVETENGVIKLEAQPELKLYWGGREMKL
jgi:(p)ppGpp synthase/HD superfamily hydrolase